MFINSCCLLTNNISFLPSRPVTEGAGMEESLETDLRQDMKVQLNRRGVYINGILYTLIAIKPF